MVPAVTGAFEAEVYDAGLGRIELKPIPTKPLGQHAQQSLAGQVVLKGDHRIISVSDQLAPFLESRSRHLLEPFIQHVVQIDICKQWRDHAALGPLRSACGASWADRPGRKPYEHGRNPPHSSRRTARCATLSSNVGMPSGGSVPYAFGM